MRSQTTAGSRSVLFGRLAAVPLLAAFLLLCLGAGSAEAKNCGVIRIPTSGPVDLFKVTKEGRTSCRVAKKITRQIRRGGKGWTYIPSSDSLRRGAWRCAEGAGGGGCTNRRTRAFVGWSFYFRSVRSANRPEAVTLETRSSRPRLPNCGVSAYGYTKPRPRRWDAGCTGGSPKFKSFRWTRWSRVAAGKGRVGLRVCDPDCVNGYLVTYKAKLRASQPTWCGGTKMYTKVIAWIRYPRGNPLGQRSGWSRSRLHAGCSS